MIDSHAGRGWQDVDRLKAVAEPLYCRSVGWLLTDNADCKVIVLHLSGEKNGTVLLQGSGDITIPQKAILNLRVLKER